MASESVAATGTLNSIDATANKVNITHGPIPALEWPGMTMDFQLGAGVSLEGIEPGAKVSFQLRKLAGGAYEIESLSPVGE
jgi:Cu/Ag efflux protein CusF